MDSVWKNKERTTEVIRKLKNNNSASNDTVNPQQSNTNIPTSQAKQKPQSKYQTTSQSTIGSTGQRRLESDYLVSPTNNRSLVGAISTKNLKKTQYKKNAASAQSSLAAQRSGARSLRENLRAFAEQIEWRTKYNPKTLQLGMVPPSAFVNLNDEKFFEIIHERVKLYETHVGERLPEDFRKYIIYCGPTFYNWSCHGISLHSWNEADKSDERPFCLWCNQPLANTKCKCDSWFDGTDLNNSEAPGLICFSHEGCGFFKFIVVKGPLKGTIYSGHPNGNPYGDDNYMSKDKESFKELLDKIYNHS